MIGALPYILQRHRDIVMSPPGRIIYSSPTQISAITSWLSVPLATVTGAGISSMPDSLNSNPAVQANDGLRPPRVAAGNGLLVAQPNNVCMSLPKISANNQLVTWGFATHIKLDNLTLQKTLFRAGPTTTTNNASATDSHWAVVEADESISLDVFLDASGANIRNARSAASVVSGSGYAFVTWECEMTASGEANQVVISVDGVVQTLAFSQKAGTAAAMPAALQGQPTGNMALFNRRSDGQNTGHVGLAGPNIYFFGSKMPFATQGLLTPAARTFLSNYERPT